MPEQNYGNLMDHEYDGIREYDNPTPSWWHIIFFISIVWAVLYFLFFTVSPLAPLPSRTHAAAENRATQRLFGEIGDLEPDEATILTFAGNDKMMAYAAGLFRGNCASCHGRNGEGNIGPNLTDTTWKNLTDVEGIHTVVANGAANGSMPAQKNMYKPNELVLLASYVVSLQGTEPANGKAAEGDEVAPWPEPPAE